MQKIKSLVLIFAIMLTLIAPSIAASAKTQESAKGDNIFFYARDSDGKSVLIKVVPLDDLKTISHGQPNGENYYISTTDNYPTTQYCEARGITVMELVEHVKRVSTVAGASSLGFSGTDTIRLMATDSYGNYNRSWTYNELYGVTRYYFEGLYDKQIGWKSGWETAGEDISKFGMTLEDYYAEYKEIDLYYNDKRAVFETGVESTPILATVSFSGRTTTDSLIASTEPGIADYIARNDGVVAGSLSDALEDSWSLRLSLPMTENDLMGARRTAFDNFKWIYNLQLEMARSPGIKSLGTVAEPVANVTVSGDTLTIAISCSTQGVSIFWSEDGAPQIPYSGPINIDIKGRDLAANPVTFYMTAVREGWDDAGIITSKYPGLSPAFKTQYNAMTGQPITFEAADAVSASDWKAWADAITFVTMKAPSAGGYTRIDAGKITSSERKITFDKSLFTETGSFSFIFHAANYADKSVSLTVKNGAPGVSPPNYAKIGMPLTFRFDENGFQNGVTLYISSADNPGGVMVATSWLDRATEGRVTLKAAYFDSPSCAIKEPGEYKFSFVNSRYEPGTIDVELRIESGELGIWDDVAADAWYFDAVRFVMGLELFDTADEDTFAPGAPMTRAMLATALWRLEQLGEAPFAYEGGGAERRGLFIDVDEDAWYAEAVAWASSVGVVNGMGNGIFAPDDSITREQIATMLYRYAIYQWSVVSGQGTEDEGDGDVLFSDADKISSYAREAMNWAVSAGLINGMGDGTVAPQGTATRAQVAAILMRYA